MQGIIFLGRRFHHQLTTIIETCHDIFRSKGQCHAIPDKGTVSRYLVELQLGWKGFKIKSIEIKTNANFCVTRTSLEQLVQFLSSIALIMARMEKD